MNIKILFDKEAANDKFVAGWGVAYLLDNTILLDTSEKPEYLFKNMSAFKVSVDQIKTVVLSHNHWDHRNGLLALIEKKKNVTVLACQDYIDQFFPQLSGVLIRQPNALEEIAPGLYSTGCWSVVYKEQLLQEQMLIAHTNNGLSLICACCHPGIIASLQKVKELFPRIPLYSIVGGLHLMDTDSRTINYIGQQLKNIGIQRLILGHCTGYEPIEILETYFPGKIEQTAVGKEFEI